MSTPFPPELRQALFATFPSLSNSTEFEVTSPNDRRYNCIAWAAQVTNQYWWPDRDGYWPPNIPRTVQLKAFSAAYATLGYVECDTEALETGVQKVALFAKDGEPTHAARQLSNGRWTSKLGKGPDIQHGLRDLEGECYGSVVKIFRRARPI